MFKLIKYTIPFLILFFCSCVTQKDNYEAIIEVVGDIKTPFYSIKKDTIELINYSSDIDKGLLNGYKDLRKIVFNNEANFSDNYIKYLEGDYIQWIDKKYKWILTEDGIDYMIKSTQKKKKINWSNNDFKKSKRIIKLVDSLKFDNKIDEDIDLQKRVKEENFIYYFSKPVFNKKRDIFIIQYYITNLHNTTTIYIYKKENNKWLKIGYLPINDM